MKCRHRSTHCVVSIMVHMLRASPWAGVFLEVVTLLELTLSFEGGHAQHASVTSLLWPPGRDNGECVVV